MPSVFSDHMVLQRGKPVPVWGWADPGEKVTVTFGGQKKKAIADKSGKWTIRLDSMKASAEGRVLVVRSQGAGVRYQEAGVTFTDVLVGEVWLCAGPSNMQWQLNGCTSGTKALARADYPQIRLLNVRYAASPIPMRDVNGTWEVCGPHTAADFSAVGFFFGERLFKEIDVPIGLIQSAGGAMRMGPWAPSAGFSSQKGLETDAAFIAEAKAKYVETMKQYDLGIVRKWADDTDAALAAGEEPPPFPTLPKSELSSGRKGNKPTTLFNSMIAPLVPYAMRGAIWYQGEYNQAFVTQHKDTMEALITSWRTLWGGEPFPFYFVQLSPCYWFHSHFGLQGTWEAQSAVLEIPKTGMVGTSDIAEPWTRHTKNKVDVGNRLALWALAKDYSRKDLVHSGPIVTSVTFTGNQAIVTFDHTAKGLKSLDGKPLSYLVMAGRDKVFYNADVEIDGDTLVLSSKKVRNPVAVRYGWCPTPEPNLGNSAGLPAIAFRSDDWKEVLSTPRLGEWRVDGGEWSVVDGVYMQADASALTRLFTGFQDWRNYTFELEAKHTGVNMRIFFRMNKKGSYSWYMDGKRSSIQARGGGSGSKGVACEIEPDTWCTLKVVAKDNTFKLFVDGKLIQTHTDKDERKNAHKTGGVGVGGLFHKAQFRNMKLTDESGKLLFGE
ncbi:MAG: DUF1080 domain-containing protein [Verrucomicrobia bacterium]|nr:DUF1080 domain-containing protein [Verrucomicrobiota bacterium]MBT7701907.1 DUF1080 domain-containing protein [Verrucomicrobiota bacterium]